MEFEGRYFKKAAAAAPVQNVSSSSVFRADEVDPEAQMAEVAAAKSAKAKKKGKKGAKEAAPEDEGPDDTLSPSEHVSVCK